MTYSIRPYSEDDFPILIQLFKEFAKFQKMPNAVSNNVELMRIEKDYFFCFIAENQEKEIIGYASFFFTYHTWSGKSVYMDDLYVKPDYRKVGIGKAFIDAIIEVGKDSGCKKLQWQVSNWNLNAKEFYQKIGAVIDDTEVNCTLKL